MIKCNKCRRYFRVTDNDYCLSKCTGCGSTDLEETIYKLPEEPTLDWKQVRADAAIAAIPAVIKTVKNLQTIPTPSCIAIECVNIADAIVAELKKR